MPSRSIRVRASVQAGVGLTLAFAFGLFALAEAPAPTSQTARATVSLRIKIVDPSGAIALDATRKVPSGSNGFDVLKETVALRSKNFGGLGERIESLCGVEPPRGKFWALRIDGKPAVVGVSQISISQDMMMEWKLQDQ